MKTVTLSAQPLANGELGRYTDVHAVRVEVSHPQGLPRTYSTDITINLEVKSYP